MPRIIPEKHYVSPLAFPLVSPLASPRLVWKTVREVLNLADRQQLNVIQIVK